MRATKETGNTIVPIKLFINDQGRAKMEIGLARGKKTYDKRQTLKEKDDKREMDRAFKRYVTELTFYYIDTSEFILHE